MTSTAHPLTDEYLRRLERAARNLPRDDRDELLAQIRSHIDDALPPGSSEGQVRNLLAELGSPEDIVAAAGPAAQPTQRGIREIAALVLLVTGFPPVLGWLAGVWRCCCGHRSGPSGRSCWEPWSGRAAWSSP